MYLDLTSNQAGGEDEQMLSHGPQLCYPFSSYILGSASSNIHSHMYLCLYRRLFLHIFLTLNFFSDLIHLIIWYTNKNLIVEWFHYDIFMHIYSVELRVPSVSNIL